MAKRMIDRLSSLLETEREALIKGDLEKVMSLTAEKTELADAFDELNGVELQALSMKLAQNGRLLAAARDGVSDVVAVLKRQREARTSLSSYDKSGNATKIGQSKAQTVRRF